MTKVKAGVEYKINVGENNFLLNSKKFQLLNNINSLGSITEAAKLTRISYRTALNYIEKIESSLEISVVSTSKGGKGGGGSAKLTSEGKLILKECKKINAIMELHKEVNELEAIVISINKEEQVMTIKLNNIDITIPMNEKYHVGDKILALISYDNIFIMLKPQESSVRNIFKGQITEISLNEEMIRVKVDVGGIYLYSNITRSAEENLNLKLGKDVYLGFKAVSIATLKL
ncbi:TOBE domain-containing protein [Methanobrevibacter sp. TMH8]|uniref:TOBE domain-containing protein n=1 Tax=Methanobrevibacter sp. TMH8 TaxID=2848611 RepID=UPI001CCB5E19|nr:TOBE domain-containing protein [Methanobrevibacter sp. TMH8]MBZ9570379.1 TOBE domain-containing protein [Methanobrevibacter sp. TMH8]